MLMRSRGTLHRNSGQLDEEGIAPSVRDKLIVTGHSLGGCIAVLVAAMLRSTYSQTRCIALSPVGGLLDPVMQSCYHSVQQRRFDD